MALSHKQIKKFEAIRKELESTFERSPIEGDSPLDKALRALEKSYAPVTVTYHGLENDVLRVGVSISKLSSKEDKKKVTDILMKHKMKKIRQGSDGARGGNYMFNAVDK